MLRSVVRKASVGLTALTVGCTTPQPAQVEAWMAAGRPAPPPQSACPAVADLDLARIAVERRERVLASRDPEATGFVTLPESAEALIPDDARVVIRANLPPSGLYSNDLRAVVWKTADGIWRVWRQDRKYAEPPPQQPPPAEFYGPEGSPDIRRRRRRRRAIAGC